MQQPNEQAQAAIASAQKLFTEKDYEKGVDHCTTIIASAPLSAEAFLLRAKASYELSKLEEDEELRKELLGEALEDLEGFKGRNFKDKIPLTMTTRREVAALTKTLKASLRTLGVEVDTTPPSSHLSLRSTSSPRSDSKSTISNSSQQSGIVTDSDRIISVFPSKNSGHGSDLIITPSIVSLKDRKASTFTPQQAGQFTIDMSISHNALTIGEKLGHGGFGEVYEGTWREKPVAIKQLLLGKLDQGALSDLQKEAQIMFKVASRSDYIVRFKGIALDREPYSLVMELMPKGSLSQLLKTGQTIPWNIRYRIALDVGYGLRDLHADGILHLDLKSMNVLLNESLRAKVTDFGLSKAREKFEESSKGKSLILSGGVGTRPWMAPEMFAHKITVSAATDVYSFGKVMYELSTSQIPPVSGTVELERSKKGQDAALKATPEALKTLMFSTWATEKTERPTLSVVTNTLMPLYEAAETHVTAEQKTAEAKKLQAEKEAALNKQKATMDTELQKEREAAKQEKQAELEKQQKSLDALQKEKEALAKQQQQKELEAQKEVQKQKEELEKMRLKIAELERKQTTPQLTPTEQPSIPPSAAPIQTSPFPKGGMRGISSLLSHEASAPQPTQAEQPAPQPSAETAAAQGQLAAQAGLFKPKPQTEFSAPKLDEKELSTFLQHVAWGRQNEAQAMLEKNRKLLLGKAAIEDPARQFEPATAFQYAVWALDWHMWKMLKPYFAKADPTGNAIRAQLAELQEKGLTYTYEKWTWHKKEGKTYGNYDDDYRKEIKRTKETSKHFDLNPLIKALGDYIPMADAWEKKGWQDNIPEAEAGYYQWQKGVGGAQRLVPAHVANEYCRKDRSFVPTPKFNEATLPRTFDLLHGNDWYGGCWHNHAKIGEMFSAFRFRGQYCGSGYGGRMCDVHYYTTAIMRSHGNPSPDTDQKSIQSLSASRTQQKDELLSEILPTRTPSHQPTP